MTENNSNDDLRNWIGSRYKQSKKDQMNQQTDNHTNNKKNIDRASLRAQRGYIEDANKSNKQKTTNNKKNVEPNKSNKQKTRTTFVLQNSDHLEKTKRFRCKAVKILLSSDQGELPHGMLKTYTNNFVEITWSDSVVVEGYRYVHSTSNNNVLYVITFMAGQGEKLDILNPIVFFKYFATKQFALIDIVRVNEKTIFYELKARQTNKSIQDYFIIDNKNII